jgi:hypothetical protein
VPKGNSDDQNHAMMLLLALQLLALPATAAPQTDSKSCQDHQLFTQVSPPLREARRSTPGFSPPRNSGCLAVISKFP